MFNCRALVLGFVFQLIFTGALFSQEQPWPHTHGPGENRLAAPIQQDILGIPNMFKILPEGTNFHKKWESESLPDSRAASVTGNFGTSDLSGGFASPVMADGMIYHYYFVPSGEAADKDLVAETGYEEKWKINADDVIIAINAQTGETEWKQIFPEKGINWNRFTKSGPGQSPVVFGDHVYAVGSAGRVYCLNKNTGALVWESDIGPRAGEMEEIRAKCIQEQVIPSFNRDFVSEFVIIDNTVLLNNHIYHKFTAPDYPKGAGGWTYHYDIDNGIMALDAQTGDSLWMKNEILGGSHNCPVSWSHGGKDYALIASKNGIRLVEPRTGNIVWDKIKSDAHGWLAPLLIGDTLITNPGSKEEGIRAYHVAINGVSEIWKMEGTGRNPVSRPAYEKGIVYYVSAEDEKMMAIELSTGKTVGSATQTTGLNREHDNGFTVVAWGKVFAPDDVERRNMHVFNTYSKENGFEYMGMLRFEGPLPAYGYISRIVPVFDNGIMYLRTRGNISAFDLVPARTAIGGSAAAERNTGLVNSFNRFDGITFISAEQLKAFRANGKMVR